MRQRRHYGKIEQHFTEKWIDLFDGPERVEYAVLVGGERRNEGKRRIVEIPLAPVGDRRRPVRLHVWIAVARHRLIGEVADGYVRDDLALARQLSESGD